MCWLANACARFSRRRVVWRQSADDFQEENAMKAQNTVVLGCALFVIAVAATGIAAAADVKLIFPPGAQIVGPYSPGLLVGKFLYVSGQGAKNAKGEIPSTTAAQVRQTFENIKNIVTAAGLSMEHLVYAQMYLTGATDFEAARAAWIEQFPGGGPALAVLGIARTPGDTPVEINAVALTDLAAKKAVRLSAGRNSGPPDAMIAGDRLFFSDCSGHGESGILPADPEAEAKAALARMGKVLAAAGIGFENVVFVNPYLTDGMDAAVMNRVYANHFKSGDTPARATIYVSRLPKGAHLTFTGVAAMDASTRRSVRPKNMPPSPTASPCVFVADTLYCSAKSAFIPGPNAGIYASTVETQVRQSIRNLLDGLEEAGMELSSVVATNVYLDDIEEFAKMNRVYASYLKLPFPTRTTVQQRLPAERKANGNDQWPMLEQISLIAVK
jgi:enamine deaminase RidA (YjgF/YER057c/UK114 family)